MKPATLTTAATPPPSRADLARYVARRVAAALHGAGYDYAPHEALLNLIARTATTLALDPGNTITRIDPNGHDEEEGKLLLVVEARSGHLFGCSIPAVRRVVRRHHEHARLLAFADAMADALEAADRQAIARTRQAAFHVIGTTP